MVKKANNLIILLILLFGSCTSSKSTDESSDFIKAENTYRKKINQYTFTLRPFDVSRLININYGDELNNFSTAKMDSITEEYKNYLCFVFEIDIENFTGDIADYEIPESTNDFESLSNYYLFGMQNSFTLRDDKGNKSSCLVYYYERLNEIAKTNRFIVGFKHPKTNEVTIEYDNPYFNCGKINFNINKQHLAFN